MTEQKLDTAMILAAGYGSRLKPLTDSTPKALIPYKGKPMIENVLNKLIAAGITDIIINTHYLSRMVEDFFEKNEFNANISLIHEDEILGTGGGIKNAAHFFKHKDNFLVYNVDVDSDLDVGKMYEHHIGGNNFATLAVKKRDTKRPLLFDNKMNLLGNKNQDGEYNYTGYSDAISYYGFTGIHIISSKIFDDFSEEGFFDIFKTYFRHVRSGNVKIKGYDLGETAWKDLGTIESLKG